MRMTGNILDAKQSDSSPNTRAFGGKTKYMYYIIQNKKKYTTEYVTAGYGDPGGVTSKAVWCKHVAGAKFFASHVLAAHFKNDYYVSRRATIEPYVPPVNTAKISKRQQKNNSAATPRHGFTDGARLPVSRNRTR